MVLEIFPLKNGDFSFWRYVHGDFSLKIYSGDFSIEFLKIFKKICSWRFFLWNMVLEIFSLKMEIFPFEDLFVEIFPWRFILEIFSLKTFTKICSWRFFLWNMVLEIFPFEDLFVEIFPWRFILEIKLLKKI